MQDEEDPIALDDRPPFAAPTVRVGDTVLFHSIWPRQDINGDAVTQAHIVKVFPGGMVNLWFAAGNGMNFRESLPHIDDPLLAEMPDRWQDGGWELSHEAQGVEKLKAELERLCEEMQEEIDELGEIINDIAKQKMERANKALENRRAGASKAQAKRRAKAMARRVALGIVDSEGGEQ